MKPDAPYRFCPLCGGRLNKKQIKEGEPQRLVCTECDFVFYIDPKVAACTIVEINNKIVLLRRSISPGYGKWVLPGGFVDIHEPVPRAAARETWEEVRLKVDIGEPVGVFSYTHSEVVVIVYEASYRSGRLQAGDETLETGLFGPHRIPWDQLAFSSTRDALYAYIKNKYPSVQPSHSNGSGFSSP